MNEEIDRNLEFRIRALEKWAAGLEEELKAATIILKSATAQADRLSIVVERIRGVENEH